MRHDDRSIMRGDAIEVAVGDRHQHFTRSPRGFRHDAIRRWICNEILKIERVRGSLSGLSRAVQSRISGTRYVPLGLGDLVILYADARRRNRGVCTFFNDSKIRGLTAHGIQESALDFAKTSDALPNSRAELHNDGILCLTKPGKERRR
jgi:hypothetical protein